MERALRSLLAALTSLKTLPPNGLVCFFGETLDQGFVSELLTPPLPVIMGYYGCGSSFATEMWEALCLSYPPVGLVVLSGTKAILGLAKGPHLFPLKTLSGILSSSTRRGGQSANRIQRLHEESVVTWLKLVEEAIQTHLFPSLEASCGPPRKPLESLILGGPADTKTLLAARLGLSKDSVFTTSQVSLEGLASHLEGWKDAKETRALKRTLGLLEETLVKRPDYLLVSSKEVGPAVKAGRVHQVFLLADELSKELVGRIQETCEAFGTLLTKVPSPLAPPLLVEGRVVAILRYL